MTHTMRRTLGFTRRLVLRATRRRRKDTRRPAPSSVSDDDKWRLSGITSGSARRRVREKERAQQTRADGERLAREKRDRKLMEKMEQQKLAREQLASYEPWGKAGGGAPNIHGVRYSNLRASGIFPEDELKGTSQYEQCRRWPSSPRRRRRTPVRLLEDPQIYHADNLRKTVDNDIRYRRTPEQQKNYKEILDDMVSKRNKELKEEVKKNLEYERKMQKMDGPWGKPGPGGTTWRNPRDIGLNFSKSMGWTDNEIFNKLKGDHKRHKRSSLTLPLVKKVDDVKDNELHTKETIKPSIVEKLPDIKHTNSANSPKNSTDETKKKKSKKQDKSKQKDVKENTCTDSTNTIKTKRKKSPKTSKFVKRLANGERVNRIVPINDFGNEINNNEEVCEKKLTPEATILRLTGGVELVPLLARRRRVGARTLPSSDVTRPPDQSCQWRDILQEDYLRVLKHQMQVKYEQKKESRQNSAESVRIHHETWASLWGRPGHGAPQRGRYARSNLAQLLYVAPLTMSQNAQ